MNLPNFLQNGTGPKKTTIVLAHGAGAPMDSLYMQTFAEGLAERAFRVIRFEFPYMHNRRTTGISSPPNQIPILLDAWATIVDHFVCLGYPFYPPGKPEKLRTEHFISLKTPTLICQGERDTFGTHGDVMTYRLSKSIRLHWLADGDHGFKPRKKSGFTEQKNWISAMDAIALFVRSLK